MRRQDLMTSNWPHRVRSNMNLFDDFDELMDSFLQPTAGYTQNMQPACDINETNDYFHVSFDMPGIKKEDIQIETQNNQLTISGERRQETREGEGTSQVRHERSYGKFQRTFSLPATIDTDKIEAHYQDGVLEVLVPKAETSKGRKVEIQSGKSGFFSKLLGDKKTESNKSRSSENFS